MAKNKLTIKVDADTSEALKQMKEVTEAANECVAALEKLEKLTNKFSGLASGGLISNIAIKNHNHTIGSSY
ncbi:hypothetical protein F8158_06845 [Bacillus cereus]|uniref:Phage protein n=1 Tax=Bacillus cereus TaxID=1396 RepID=A0AB34DDC8_BACCE|nr:hypothetical protein [Bacillus cereus]KAB2500799.1 hypothetical protein F8158_06845 [Bacillus cereus]